MDLQAKGQATGLQYAIIGLVIVSIALSGAAIFLVSGAASDINQLGNQVNELQKEVGAVAKKPEKVTIKDSAGRVVTVSQPVERIVSLNSDSAEAIRMLNAENRIVGITKYIKNENYWGKIVKKPVVGGCFSPNYEKIADLNPDVVISYAKWAEDLEEKLAPFGIKVIRLDFYKSKTVKEEILELGKILGKKKRAREFVGWLNEHEKQVKEKVKEIKPKTKVRAYIEGYRKWESSGPGSGWHQQVTMAGALNIAENLGTAYPEVSAEWVAKKNPDVIVKAVSSREKAFGYSFNSVAKAEALRDQIANRKGLSTVKAVKNGEIYLLSGDVFSSIKYVVGTEYFAKNFYPEKCKDLHPKKTLNEYLRRFQGVEPKGVWAYPRLSQAGS